ncbi:MAG: hypothetical protein F4126_13490, partial [Acidimicrobiaceae bacterium]|nr:hypothetical protein [Acidimicrobiaceae bacterium]MYH94713.1 hypothetical protein [Acidimicrobiaceae bacterium]
MPYRSTRNPSARLLAGLLTLALVAAACGGGDGGEPPAPAAADTTETAAPAEPDDSGGATGEAPAATDTEPEVVEEEQELLVAPVDTTTTTAPPPDDDEGVAEAPAEPEPQYGGTLRVGAFAEGDGLNPASNAFSTPVYLMAYPVFDPLAYYDTEGNWVPV